MSRGSNRSFEPPRPSSIWIASGKKSLAYITGLSREEYTNTVTRMRENQAIVRWVQTSVNERVASYRLALERMVIAAPSPMAVEAERSLTLLQQRAGAHGV
jgi:hypothetical protein